MENRLKELEQRLDALEQRTLRTESFLELQNLMSRHQFLMASGEGERIVKELYAKDDTISVEYGASGIYRGTWKVETYYVKDPVPGRFSVTAVTCGYLEADALLEHARGLWIGIGTDTDAGELGDTKVGEDDPRRQLFDMTSPDGKGYRADWLWQVYEVFFVREEGTFKIHDLHVSEFFRCPFGKDWVRFSEERKLTDGIWLEEKFEAPDEVYPPGMRYENLPFDATSYHWQYDVNAVYTRSFAL